MSGRREKSPLQVGHQRVQVADQRVGFFLTFDALGNLLVLDFHFLAEVLFVLLQAFDALAQDVDQLRSRRRVAPLFRTGSISVERSMIAASSSAAAPILLFQPRGAQIPDRILAVEAQPVDEIRRDSHALLQLAILRAQPTVIQNFWILHFHRVG